MLLGRGLGNAKGLVTILVKNFHSEEWEFFSNFVG